MVLASTGAIAKLGAAAAQGQEQGSHKISGATRRVPAGSCTLLVYAGLTLRRAISAVKEQPDTNGWCGA